MRETYRENILAPSFYSYNCHGKESSSFYDNVPSGGPSIYSKWANKYPTYSSNKHVTNNRNIYSDPLVYDQIKVGRSGKNTESLHKNYEKTNKTEDISLKIIPLERIF